jgi:hypothetical protein
MDTVTWSEGMTVWLEVQCDDWCVYIVEESGMCQKSKIKF